MRCLPRPLREPKAAWQSIVFSRGGVAIVVGLYENPWLAEWLFAVCSGGAVVALLIRKMHRD